MKIYMLYNNFKLEKISMGENRDIVKMSNFKAKYTFYA